MIARVYRSGSFANAVQYCQGKAIGGRALGSSVLTSDPKGPSEWEIIRELLVVNEAKEAARPVVHIPVRTRDGEHLSEEQWLEVAERVRTEMGYENCPWAAYLHNNEGGREGQHLHLVLSRVTFDGKIVSDRFERYRVMEVMRGLERDFGLEPVLSRDRNQPRLYPHSALGSAGDALSDRAIGEARPIMPSEPSKLDPMSSPVSEPMGERRYTPTEAARLLGLEYGRLLTYVKRLSDQLQVRRDRNRLYLSEADIEALRQYCTRSRATGLTLRQIAAQLGVPFNRVKKLAGPLRSVLPRPETTRKGLYAPEALEILRKQLVRSARKTQSTNEAAEYWRALAVIRIAARQLDQISRDLLASYSRLRDNPPSVTAYIHTLAAQEWILARPIAAVVSPLRRSFWRASLLEAKLQGVGQTIDDAVLALQAAFVSALRDSETPRELRTLLEKLVRPRRRPRRGARTSGSDSREAQAP